jgi:hypothetical protein
MSTFSDEGVDSAFKFRGEKRYFAHEIWKLGIGTWESLPLPRVTRSWGRGDCHTYVERPVEEGRARAG